MILPEPDVQSAAITLIPEVTTARTLIPLAGPPHPAWTGGAEPYDDSTWTGGTTGVGFERSMGYETYIGTDTTQMYRKQGSAFVRIGFDVADPARLESVTLWMRYDDGFVAYLNGREIARANAPETPAWNSVAADSHDDAVAVIFQPFEIPGVRRAAEAGPQHPCDPGTQRRHVELGFPHPAQAGGHGEGEFRCRAPLRSGFPNVDRAVTTKAMRQSMCRDGAWRGRSRT